MDRFLDKLGMTMGVGRNLAPHQPDKDACAD
jgi:hypothetical protein